jgi:uncharacterized membrane protein YfhO
MNYDRGWEVDGAPALEHKRAVATRVRAARGTITLRYRPPGLRSGLAIFLVTVLVFLVAPRVVPRAWRRWRERRRVRG